jgi:hypothetical protein
VPDHLLHIDSSIKPAGASVSRALSARAARGWSVAHPGGTVTRRDLGAAPLPHLDTASGLARMIAPDDHTPAHAEPWLPHALSQIGLEPQFITAELTLADTVPQMAELKPLAAESLAAAQRAIDALWSPVAA